jgi:hypothetical protein
MTTICNVEPVKTLAMFFLVLAYGRMENKLESFVSFVWRLELPQFAFIPSELVLPQNSLSVV